MSLKQEDEKKNNEYLDKVHVTPYTISFAAYTLD